MQKTHTRNEKIKKKTHFGLLMTIRSINCVAKCKMKYKKIISILHLNENYAIGKSNLNHLYHKALKLLPIFLQTISIITFSAWANENLFNRIKKIKMNILFKYKSRIYIFIHFAFVMFFFFYVMISMIEQTI